MGVHYRSSAEKAKKLLAELPGAFGIQADLTVPEEVDELMGRLKEEAGTVDVLVNTGRVGGNSAGLALTLSILDLVTPGELTGGLRVATTGTIDIDGNVGPIGGIVQKVAAAEEAGIDLLLVPVTELADAREHAGDLAVEGVSTLDDALAALARHGGESRDLVLPDG